MKKFLVAGVLFILFFFLAFKISAWAEESSTSATPKAPFFRSETREVRQEKASEAAARRAEKLSEARLKLCKARAKSLENRSKSLLLRANGMRERTEKIVELVSKFYEEKLVPQGKTLSNYDALLSDIATKKANVASFIDQAKNDVSGFSCEGDDPKTILDTFHADMKEVIAAIKEYHAAVKTFVSAVRDLAKAQPSVSPSPGAEEGNT